MIAEAAALALSERRYRSLVEAIAVQAVWVANPAGEKLDDSPGFRRLTGLSLEEYRGFGWMKALHPDDRGPAERQWAAALQSKRIYEAEYRVRLATGEYRWFAAYGVPVIENGEVVEWVGTFTDIHSQKLLREGKRFLIEAGEILASTLDEATVLQTAAAVAVPALGDYCVVDQADLRDEAEIVHGETDMMSVALKVRGAVIGTMRFMLSDPTRRYGEEELHLASELAHRVAMAIDNARLYAEAANANHAKDIFLATLSHEMKTPLTAILGWTRMLRDEGPCSDLFDEALTAVEQSARVQERLIEDILDVSRVITGKLNIEKKPLDLCDVISAAVEIVTPMAEQNGVRLRVQVQTGLSVDGDETRLRQVMWNLLTNAVKFTPAGGFIEIITERKDAEVSVTVRDSGRGIRPQTLPHLFEQFHQESVAGRAGHRGLGLGLAIVRHLVLAHGGSVKAHSEGEGKGSEFTVKLPLVAADVTEVDDAALMVQGEGAR